MAYLVIPKDAELALEKIAGLPIEDFKKLADQIITHEPPSIRASALFDAVVQHSGEKEYSVALCNQLVSLATFVRSEKESAEDTIDGLVRGISQTDLRDEVVTWYQDARDILIGLLNAPLVKLPAKALHLSGDFQNEFRSANIVSDIRPIFRDDRDEVVGAVVIQTLRLRYVADGRRDRPSEISIALDLDDVSELLKELNNAIQKAEESKKQFDSLLTSEVFVVGEERYGFG